MNPANFVMSRTFISTVTAILATGAILNLAGKGTFGATAQNIAKHITTGYGAGAA